MKTRAIGVAVLALVVAGVGGSAAAQWTVVDLNRGSVSDGSVAMGVYRSRQVGWYALTTGGRHACRWNGTAATLTDMNPVGAAESVAEGADANSAAGWTRPVEFGATHAAFWSDSTGHMDLHPVFAVGSSIAYDAAGGYQAGVARVDSSTPNTGASLWAGNATSWVPLNAPGAVGTKANSLTGLTEQVGSATIGGVERAARWTSATHQYIDLHPAGATFSEARGCGDGQQVGYAQFSNVYRACLWNGTAGSYVDLHPSFGASSSIAFRVHQGQQVGRVVMGGISRAALWSGTGASRIDLHALLPAGLSGESVAYDLWHEGGATYIAGYAATASTGAYHAVLWVRSGCATADFNGDGDTGTDGDIEAYFACLAGTCCAGCSLQGSDFNGDGDAGTDGDIEAFFRVLAGGTC